MGNNKTSPVEKAAAFIVDKRKAFYLVYICLAVFSVVSNGWVKVNNDISDYLADDTETHIGLSIMDEEFVTYATAQIMVDNISYDTAESLCSKLEDVEGVKEVAFDDTEKHYANSAAMFTLTFDGEDNDPISAEALENAQKILEGYDTYVSAELGDTKANTIQNEINIVMVITVVIILIVLFFTSQTYMEIPVMLLTFGMAALLNVGTNYMFGTISFVSNSIAVILQLALAIDYAIILCHRYTEEREKMNAREAVITALSKAIPEISGSCLTTLSGLAAMMFMHFRLGYDMGIILIKAVLLSIVCVFTLMPGLLMSFSALIDKTHHKNFVPKINIWGKIVVKLRYITPVIFAVLIVGGFFFSNMCPYAYSYTNLTTIAKNDSQIADEMIRDTFRSSNTLAVLVPTGDYEKEKALLTELESYDEIDTAMGIANIEAIDGYCLADKLTPRNFSELIDMDIEVVDFLYAAYAVDSENYGAVVGGIDSYGVPLIDMFTFVYDKVDEGYVTLDDDLMDDLEDLHEQLEDGKKQLKGPKHSRLVLDLNIPEESKETFAFLETVRDTAKKYYGDDVVLAGNSTSDFDLSSTFGEDNVLISVLSVVFVMAILLFTFQSAGLPVILILVIQGSIWINFSFPYLQSKPLFFLSYLVVSSIQMGANIDYAIVITSRYTEFRQTMPKKQAIVESLNFAFPTILTSGTILACAGAFIGLLSSDAAISSIGSCLGRGTLISMVLVMLILPQLLLLGDFLIDKTSLKFKAGTRTVTTGGITAVNGIIHGNVNGRLDGIFYGTVNGEIDAKLSGVKENGTDTQNTGGTTDDGSPDKQGNAENDVPQSKEEVK